MARDLKVGDVVRVGAGGPKMTVEGISVASNPPVKCVWFQGSDKTGWSGPHYGWFYKESLRKVVP